MTLRIRCALELASPLREQVEQQLAAAAPRRSKYGNARTEREGLKFDSKLEARCFEWLTLRAHDGEVAWFIRQPSFDLPGGVRYRADFLVVLTRGGVEVIDAKGHDTQASRNKRKQVRAIYGIDVRLWPPR